MDPVTMILAALAAGVVKAVGDVVPLAIKDSYEGLKALIAKRFAGNDKAEQTLTDHEADPDTYEKPMARQLEETGATADPEILAAARSVLQAARQSGVTTKYSVSVSGGTVGAIGDNARVTIN